MSFLLLREGRYCFSLQWTASPLRNLIKYVFDTSSSVGGTLYNTNYASVNSTRYMICTGSSPSNALLGPSMVARGPIHEKQLFI